MANILGDYLANIQLILKSKKGANDAWILTRNTLDLFRLKMFEIKSFRSIIKSNNGQRSQDQFES